MGHRSRDEHGHAGVQFDDFIATSLLKTSTVKYSSNNIQHTLQTLRYKLFAKPAYITTESRKPILHMAVAMQQRTWMQGLWDASKAFEIPAKFTSLYTP